MRRHRLLLVIASVFCAAAALAVAGLNHWFPQAQELRVAEDAGDTLPAPNVHVDVDDDIVGDALRSVDVTPCPMPLLKAGLPVGDDPPPDWSHLVLHAVPRVAEGDVDRVSALVARLTSLFHLVVAANVEQGRDSDAARYRLGAAAIGLAMEVNGGDVTVSSGEALPAGASLNFMERTALVQSEVSLKAARQVARTPTMLVFDAESVMLRDDDHRPTIQRHALVVSPRDGRLATFVWALAPEDGLRFCGEVIERLPDALHEDRVLHVDAGKFVLGVPTQEAFALLRLPQGESIAATADLRQSAAGPFANPQQAVQLERALQGAIGWDSE